MSNAISLLRRARGAAIARYRGQLFYTKDAFNLVPDLKAFDVESDSTPPVDSRYGGRLIKSTWTPIGAWTDGVLPVLFPYANFTKGQWTTPVRKVTAVVTAADTLQVKKHKQIAGTGVVIVSTGTVPGGLTSNVVYFVIVVDEDTLKLAATEADALADPAVPIDITSIGSGTIKVVQNTPLLINYLDVDQTQIAFWNAAITKMPSLSLGATKTALGQVEFTCYGKHGSQWSDDDSVFTIGTHDDDPAAIDPTGIPTVPYTAQFGESAPFSDLKPRDGVTVDFNLGLSEIGEDGLGIYTHQLADLRAMAKLLPLNVTEGDLWGEMLMQGAGAGMGKSLPFDTLSLFGPDNNPFIALYGAGLMEAPLKIGSKEDRVDTINFKTKQTFTDGVANQVFYVGTQAPA